MSDRVRSAPLVALGVLVLTAPGSGGQTAAQEPPDRLQTLAALGWTVSVRDLGKITYFGAVTPVPIRVRLEAGPTLGGGAAYRLGGGATLRVTAHHAFTTATGEAAACQALPDARCERRDLDASVTAGVAEVLFHRDVGMGGVRPFLSLGLGLRRYAFSEPECPAGPGAVICDVTNDFLDDQFQPLAAFGLGLELELGPADLFLRVRNLVGRYDEAGSPSRGENQNDLHVSAGVTLRGR